MLGNRKFICDTFSEVYELVKPWVDQEFWLFADIEHDPTAVYMIGRAQFNENVERIRDIVESGTAIVIISNPAEGSETLKHHMQRAGFDQYCRTGQVLLIGGGDMEPSFHYLQYDSFLPKVFSYTENVKASKRIVDIFEQTDKPYKFLFLNGRARPNRKYLLQYFQHIGLLEHAIWTNLDVTSFSHQSINLPINGEDAMLNPMPVKRLDEKYEVSRYTANLINPDNSERWAKPSLFAYNGTSEWGEIYLNPAAYIDTYFSVVTETIFTYPYSFRTEKIWKPIAMGHPFVAVSNCGYYRDLRNLGFKTFNHLIDESFDNIYNDLDRLERIRDVIINLCNSDLVSFLTAAREVCEYNQQHLWEMRKLVRKEFPQRFRQFLITQGAINE